MGAESELALLLGIGGAALAVGLMSTPIAFPAASRRVHQFCFWIGMIIAVACFAGAFMVAIHVQMPTGRRLVGLIGMAGFGLAFIVSAVVFAHGGQMPSPKVPLQSDRSAEPAPTDVGPFGAAAVSMFGVNIKGQVPEGIFGKNVAVMRGVKLEDRQEKPVTVESPVVVGSSLNRTNLKQDPGSIATSNNFDGDRSSTFEYEGKDGAFVANQVTDYGHISLKNSGGIFQRNTFKAPAPKATQASTTPLADLAPSAKNPDLP